MIHKFNNNYCDICNEETDEWYEIPCRYNFIDTKGRKRKRAKEKRYICVNCWMAIQGAVQKERGQEAIFEEIYKKGVKEWNKEWERTHKWVPTDDGFLQLVVMDEVSE